MRTALKMLWLLLPALAVSLPVQAQDRPLLIKAKRVFTGEGKVLKPGFVLVHKGEIIKVGSSLDRTGEMDYREYPKGTIIPGLVAAYSHLAVTGGYNEESSEVTPNYAIARAVNPWSPQWKLAIQKGLTTVHVLPARLNVIGGRSAVVRPGEAGKKEFIWKDRHFLCVALGQTPSSGNRNMRYGRPVNHFYRRPNTRMGVVWLIEKSFGDGQKYLERESAKGLHKEVGGPYTEAELKTLVAAMKGKVPVFALAEGHQDVASALRLAKKYGWNLVVDGDQNLHRLVPRLAGKKPTPVILEGPSMGLVESSQKYVINTAQLLHQQGVPFALRGKVDANVPTLLHTVAAAVRYGLPPEVAIKAVTMTPAKILGLDGEVGSLAKGKMADLVVLHGDPWELTTRVVSVYSRGKVVYRPTPSKSGPKKKK